MRISLLYNERAGDNVTVETIVAAIERHGHELVSLTDKRARSAGLLRDSPDLVVAAGGDGTVAAAARLVAGSDTPFTLLPLGTANNIARSLGIAGPLEALIAGWNQAPRTFIDLGAISGSLGVERFVEGVGGGWIVHGIDRMHARSAEESPDEKVGRALRVHAEALADLTPAQYRLAIDGAAIEGEFLVVSVLNMPSIGPNLVLSAGVSPSDGWLSVVIAEERHRAELARFLRQRQRAAHAGEARDSRDPAASDAPQLLHVRARRVDFHGDYRLHVDDDIRQTSGTTTVRILPAAASVLVPRDAAGNRRSIR